MPRSQTSADQCGRGSITENNNVGYHVWACGLQVSSEKTQSSEQRELIWQQGSPGLQLSEIVIMQSAIKFTQLTREKQLLQCKGRSLVKVYVPKNYRFSLQILFLPHSLNYLSTEIFS